MDILIDGARSTWSNFQGDPTLRKLDLFLVSLE